MSCKACKKAEELKTEVATADMELIGMYKSNGITPTKGRSKRIEDYKHEIIDIKREIRHLKEIHCDCSD